MADKSGKAKNSAKVKTAPAEKTDLAKPAPTKAAPEKAVVVPAKAAVKSKEKSQPKPPGRMVRWWRETIGELRKVTWPTIPEARRMTGIVLIVTAVMAVVLGLLDFIFSQLVGFLIAL